jgi:hypothetical protein
MNAQVQWPYFTDPSYHIIGNNFRTISGAELVAIAPIVVKAEQQEWESYSVENDGWIHDGLLWLSETEDLPYPDSPITDIPTNIYRLDNGRAVLEDGDGPFAPVWQMARAPTNSSSAVNFNLLSHPTFARVFDIVEESRRPVLSEVFGASELFGGSASSASPTSILVLPIVSGFGNNAAAVSAALIAATLSWDTFLWTRTTENHQTHLSCSRQAVGKASRMQSMETTFHFWGMETFTIPPTIDTNASPTLRHF